jgi:hypothetical protein
MDSEQRAARNSTGGPERLINLIEPRNDDELLSAAFGAQTLCNSNGSAVDSHDHSKSRSDTPLLLQCLK